MRIAFPISICLIIGALTGYVFGNFTVGAAIGAGIGTAIGVAMNRKPPPSINPD